MAYIAILYKYKNNTISYDTLLHGKGVFYKEMMVKG